MPFRYMTAGESHGPEMTAITEGIPAGLSLEKDYIDRDLGRRQLGHGRGGRMKIETDKVRFTSGVRHGLTIGTPIAMRIENADWKNWSETMAAGKPGSGEKGEVLRVPRPGHADLAGIQKFGMDDIRSVLERASARETAARVAVGAVARKLLAEFGIEIVSHVVSIGGITSKYSEELMLDDFSLIDSSPVRCLDENAEKGMVTAIDQARDVGESLGGVFEIMVFGLVPGLGSYTTGPGRLSGRIGGALMSIPAIKGAEIGGGFQLSNMPGSAVHDEIYFQPSTGFHRRTNNAGGLEGGMTNGEPLVARACMKPIPTLTKPLRSIDLTSGAEELAFKERSDVCAVPAAAVVGEAMVAIELAGAFLEKFGGDSIADIKEAFLAYLRRLRGNWPND